MVSNSTLTSNNKSTLENNTLFLILRWGQSFAFWSFAHLILLWDLTLTPEWLQSRHLLRKALLLFCHTFCQPMQFFTCRGLQFCSCRGISSRPGDIFLLPHRGLGVDKLGFLRCAVAFLQGLTVITRLHLALPVLSLLWHGLEDGPCLSSGGSAGLSRTIISQQLFADGKQIGLYGQRNPLMLATRKGVVHLNRTFRDTCCESWIKGRHCERWRQTKVDCSSVARLTPWPYLLF